MLVITGETERAPFTPFVKIKSVSGPVGFRDDVSTMYRRISENRDK